MVLNVTVELKSGLCTVAYVGENGTEACKCCWGLNFYEDK